MKKDIEHVNKPYYQLCRSHYFSKMFLQSEYFKNPEKYTNKLTLNCIYSLTHRIKTPTNCHTFHHQDSHRCAIHSLSLTCHNFGIRFHGNHHRLEHILVHCCDTAAATRSFQRHLAVTTNNVEQLVWCRRLISHYRG